MSLQSLRYSSKKLRHVVWQRRSHTQGYDDFRPYVGLEHLEPWTGRLLGDVVKCSDGDSVNDVSLSNIFESGDVLFGKLRPYLAKAWIAEFQGQSSAELLAMKPIGIEPRFLLYVCLSRYFVDLVNGSTFGSKMPRSDWDFIGNIHVPIPERCKQQLIVDFLDRETAQIDALISAKELMLDLLFEKHRACITYFMTRNFDSNTSAKRLKYVVRLCRSRTQDCEGGSYVSLKDIQPWTGQLLRNVGDSNDCTSVMSVGNNFESGDVLFGKLRPYLAKAWIAEFQGQSSTEFIVMRPTEVEPRFLLYTCLSQYFVGLVNSATFGSKMPRVDWTFMGNIRIPIPEWNEQQNIVSQIDQEIMGIERLRVKTEHSINLLKERRTALVTAAVTGQIHVEEMVS